MADDRTDEQREADEALRKAIETVNAVYNEDELTGVVTDFLVVYAEQGWDDDGDAVTAVGTHVPDNSAPVYRLLGLAEFAAARFRGMASEE